MSRRESGTGRRRGPTQTMFFDQEWHPEQCNCTQCHQEEQQVLSQFENEMNRLEDKVKKSNLCAPTCLRHIETEWLPERRASLGVSSHSAESPEEPPTLRDLRLPHSTSWSPDEGREEEEEKKGDLEDAQREHQRRNSGEAVNHESDDDVGLSFAREMYEVYKHYEVCHVMQEQWPPEQTWNELCGEDEHHRYSNGTYSYRRFAYNSHNHPSDCDCKHIHGENTLNHPSRRSSSHSQTQGRTGGQVTQFSSVNQECYSDSVSTKKSKRKLTLRLKDTIRRRYTYHPRRPLAFIRPPPTPTLN